MQRRASGDQGLGRGSRLRGTWMAMEKKRSVTAASIPTCSMMNASSTAQRPLIHPDTSSGSCGVTYLAMQGCRAVEGEVGGGTLLCGSPQALRDRVGCWAVPR